MNVREILAAAAGKRILVIGDFIVDVRTEVERINPLDDATPVYRKIAEPERGKTDIYSEGGAALVVRNLLELGCKVEFVTAYGYGAGILDALNFRHPNLQVHGAQVPKAQTVKHRFWSEGKKVFAVDTFDNANLSDADAERTIRSYTEHLVLCDAVIVADYRHGLISEVMARDIVNLARNAGKPIYVASQVAQSESNHHWYDAESTIFVLNNSEWHAIGGSGNGFAATLFYKTWGDLGAYVVDRRQTDPVRACKVVDAIPVDVIDACGAGDAFLAAISLSVDIEFANIWAGLSCTVVGANPPTQKMLFDWCENGARKSSAA